MLCLDGGGRSGIWTFAGSKAPAAAQAAGPQAAATIDLEASLKEVQQSQKPVGGKIFSCVDDALEAFLGGWKAPSIAADEVQRGAFDLGRTVQAQAARQQQHAVGAPQREMRRAPAASTAAAA
jgi:hypothetical protein